MTTVAEQVQYESRLRFRLAGVAFAGAVLLVLSELLQLSGAKPPVSEATVSLITYNSRSTVDTFASVVDLLGLFALAYLLFWMHRRSQLRVPQLRSMTRWAASGGAVIAGVMGLAYTIIFIQKAHQFVTTGDQSWPQANHLFSSALWIYPQLILELGNLLLAVGAILVSLSAMRVGLIPRIVGYTGVISGALFIFGVPILTPIIQGYWLAATAVVLARRWPSGDPPAWESGVAVPWPPTQRQQAQAQRGSQRGSRRKVSDKDVLAAVEKGPAPPNQQAGRSKRKRRR